MLLMDEPFSALDYQTRLRMRRELVRLLRPAPAHGRLRHPRYRGGGPARRPRASVLSERPARVQRELRLDTPRPRDLTHPSVLEAIEQISRELGLTNAEEDATALNLS